MIKPELLSPAGDRERLEAAVDFGADAVYLGASNFNARAGATNFNYEELNSNEMILRNINNYDFNN